MSRKDDLEQAIAESNDLINQYQAIIRESESPKAKAGAQRGIVEQRGLTKEYLTELRALNEKHQVELDALIRDDEPREAAQREPLPEARDATSGIRVFISYSHDSPEHTSRMLALANRLRGDGIDCQLDQYETSPSEGWPRWMERQLREANFVLVVCTEPYLRRAEGREVPSSGRGARWESTLLYQHFYDADTYNTRFIPIFWNWEDEPHIPVPLRGATYYCVADDDSYWSLYRHLTDQPKVSRPEVGSVRKLDPLDSSRPSGPDAKSSTLDDGDQARWETAPFNISDPIRYEWEGIPLALDVLDALVDRYLPGPAAGWCDFDREQPTLGSVVYKLRQWQLGPIGTLELRKTSAKLSTIVVRLPPRPEPSVPGDERQDLYLRRRAHQAKVLDLLHSGMESDMTWAQATADAHLSPASQESLGQSGDEVVRDPDAVHAKDRGIAIKGNVQGSVIATGDNTKVDS